MKKTNRSKHSKELKVLSSRECRRLAKRAASMALAAALAASTLCAPALAVDYTIDLGLGLGTVHIGSNESGVTVSWQEGNNVYGSLDKGSTDKDVNITGAEADQNYVQNNQGGVDEVEDGAEGSKTASGNTTDQVLNVETDTNASDMKVTINGVDAEVETGSVVNIADGTGADVDIKDSHLTTNDKNSAAIRVGSGSKVSLSGNTSISSAGTGVQVNSTPESTTTLIIGGAEVQAGTLILSPVNEIPQDPEPQEDTQQVTIETTGTGVELNGDVDVTLGGATIESTEGAAMSVESGSATIELDGENYLTGGETSTTASAGLHVAEEASVTIQDGEETEKGSLTAQGGEINIGKERGAAGIGGNLDDNQAQGTGNITIEGGRITATGGYGAAGIGSGSNARDISGYGEVVNTHPEEIAYEGDITITGGHVTAHGGKNGAGIGSGELSKIGDITISGGEIVAEVAGGSQGAGIGSGGQGAKAGNITISGEGTIVNVNASNGAGAGIGAGYSYSEIRGEVESITINGGTVTATGGMSDDYYGGPGIGAGSLSKVVGSITINGGNIQATGGGSSAGIGSGFADAEVGEIIISNGQVRARGGDYGAGIGTGFGDEWSEAFSIVQKITITGGKVEAFGGKYGAGIGAGRSSQVGNILIEENATVSAIGGNYAAGIGASRNSTVGSVEITGGTVTAKGGKNAAGIGAGNKESSFDTINITGGNITAISGKEASGIGYGSTGPADEDSKGQIVIAYTDTPEDGILKVYGDEYFAIDTRADVAGVTASILNGKFLEELNVEDSNGLYKEQDATFEIRDENDKLIHTFTLTYDKDGKFLYDSFAVNLAPGTYTIVNVAANENEEPAYDGKQVQGDPNYDAEEAKNLTLKFVVTGETDGSSNLSTYNWLQFYTPTGGSGGEEIVTPNPDPDDGLELILTEVPTEEELPEEETPLAAAPEEIEEEETPLSDAPVVDESLAEIGDDDVALSGAPKTGDESGVFGLMAALSGMALAVMSFFDRKGRHARFGSQH